MAEVFNVTSNLFMQIYTDFKAIFPTNLQIFPPLLLVTFLIALYAIFVWVFYRFLAQRDLLSLNLSQYNKLENAIWVKFLAVILYILEFVIILPFMVIFWFAVFSILLIVLAKGHTIGNIMLIAASIVAAIRITAYYKEDLSRDLAKMIPFTFLGVAILTPGFFDMADTLSKLSEIPLVFENLVFFALFIVLIEVLLRLIYLSVTFGRTEEERKKDES